MQLGLPFRQPPARQETVITLAGHPVRVQFVRHCRARHYILRVGEDGGLRVTVPRNGSRAEALRFVEGRRAWIERERYRRITDAARRGPWREGTRLLFRGETATLAVTPLDTRRARVSFAGQAFNAPVAETTNLRASVERYLRRVATIELPERLARLAAEHGFEVAAVTIRSQRSRWGSCSRAGRVSLNWRLIQFPARVVDYVLIHELVHLRHMNHSARFWREMAGLCPAYQESRLWLRQHGGRAVDLA